MPRNSLLCWLAAAAMAMAQAPNQTPPPPANEKPASVSGEVRNSLSGLPIERAHVSVRVYRDNGWDRYGALTNAEGKYTILGIPAGPYNIMMDRTGYIVPAEVTRSQLVLKPDEKKDNYHLKLIPVGSILGRVVNGEGAPLGAISVQAIQAGHSNFSATTDDRGQYRIGGLAPGRYRIRAVAPPQSGPPEIRTDGTAEIHYASTYFPGELEQKAARRIEVGPATDVTGIDIRLVPTPIVHVSGRVAGLPEGAKNVGIQVLQGQNYASGAQARPDGTFELWRLDPGNYTFQAQYNNLGEQMSSAPVQAEVGQADVENLELRLAAPEDLHGQIAFDDEMARPAQPSQTQQRPQQGQNSQPRLQPQNLPTQISLRDTELGSIMRQEPVADDGTFTLTKVQPGKYVVAASGYPAYVKSVQIGKTDSGGPELDLSSSANGAALTVRLASTFGTLSGVVSDDKGPAAGIRITIRDTQNRGIIFTARSKADGTYSAPRLPPGKYRMMVQDDDASSQALNDPAMEDFDEAFDIGPNQTVTRDLKLRPVTGKLE